MNPSDISPLSLQRPHALTERPQAALSQTRPQAVKEDEEREVATSFEAMFLQQMLKGMRSGGMDGKKEFGRQTFEEMFDEQVARAVAEQGLGLGEALFANSTATRTQDSGPLVDSAHSGAVLTPLPGQRGR